MKQALLFPGQGAQYEGMCRDLYDTYPEVRELFESARPFIPDSRLPFELSAEELKKTRYTQCALFLHSAAVLEILKGIEYSAAAGFSLGECTALYASGMLSFEDALRLISIRSALMDAAAEKHPGKMYAIVGGDRETPNVIAGLCEEAQPSGYVAPVNFNCVGQTVIAGDEKAADLVASKLGELSLRAIPLNTSGAFHCSFMKEAADTFEKELERFTFKRPETVLYSNVTGEVYDDSVLSDMPGYLAKHIVSPVRFSTIVENMIGSGIERFIEIGCGKTLTGFVRRTDRSKEIFITQDAAQTEDLKSLLNI